MSEPLRLLSGASQLERELLAAGRAERPSSRSRRRAALALAVATGTSLWSRLALALRSTGGIAGAPLVKLAALVLAGGVSLAVVATRPASSPKAGVVKAPSHAPSAARVPSAALATSSATPTAPPALSVDAEGRSAMVDQPAQPVPPERSSEHAARDAHSDTTIDALSAEVQAIDQARAALREPQRALGLLDEYARNYPQGRLQQEALVLRVQALLAAGKREQAALVARRFSAQHPASPYSRRLASLVAAP